jgi:hypothetical protein
MNRPDDPVVQLTPESIEAYFAAQVSTTHLVARDPRCELAIHPGREAYELFTPAVGNEPEIVGLQRVAVDTVAMDDGPWFRLRVDAKDMRYETYGLVLSVVEAMRGGASFAAATGAALTNMRAVLATKQRLSPDQQVGLIGELLVVRRFLDHCSEIDVIDWWLGPLAEQHDLALPDYDVEVKTTKAERRVHVIHGTGQLRPNPARPLWLLSIQITRAGGAHGVSLTGIVDEVRDRLAVRREAFLEHLVGLGWRDSDADLYRDTWMLRTPPLAYLVDDDFPAITEERLTVVVPHTDLVSDLTYRVDVTTRPATSPGEPLTDFLSNPDGTGV